MGCHRAGVRAGCWRGCVDTARGRVSEATPPGSLFPCPSSRAICGAFCGRRLARRRQPPRDAASWPARWLREGCAWCSRGVFFLSVVALSAEAAEPRLLMALSGSVGVPLSHPDQGSSVPRWRDRTATGRTASTAFEPAHTPVALQGGTMLSKPTPVRMPTDLIALLDTLAADMAAAGCPEVAASGAQWGRSSLIRLLLARGAGRLRAERGLPHRGGAGHAE